MVPNFFMNAANPPLPCGIAGKSRNPGFCAVGESRVRGTHGKIPWALTLCTHRSLGQDGQRWALELPPEGSNGNARRLCSPRQGKLRADTRAIFPSLCARFPCADSAFSSINCAWHGAGEDKRIKARESSLECPCNDDILLPSPQHLMMRTRQGSRRPPRPAGRKG